MHVLSLPCSICGKPVELEVSKTDSHGEAVHEECYPARKLSEKTPNSPNKQPWARLKLT